VILTATIDPEAEDPKGMNPLSASWMLAKGPGIIVTLTKGPSVDVSSSQISVYNICMLNACNKLNKVPSLGITSTLLFATLMYATPRHFDFCHHFKLQQGLVLVCRWLRDGVTGIVVA
jgi:hypothetical protein